MNETVLILSNGIALLILIFLIVVFYRLVVSKKAPFIPIPSSALFKLLSPIAPQKNDVVYDLGCGDGRVLTFLAQKYPDARFKGIELRLFPYILAKMRTHKYKNITIYRGDFFKFNISDASFIVVYLFPHVLNLLLPKFKTELKNTTLVSFDFEFQEKEPTIINEIPERIGKLGSKSIVYRFE